MAPAIPKLPSGDSKPRANSSPPPNSDNAAIQAHGAAGRIRSVVTGWVQPAIPGPPHQPKSFWAPCAATVSPTTTRRIRRPRFKYIVTITYLPPAFSIPLPDGRGSQNLVVWALSEARARIDSASSVQGGGPVAQLVRAADS